MPAAYPYLDPGRAKVPAPGAHPRWGKQGRVNLVGTPCFEGEDERPEFRLLEGSCRSGEAVAYRNLLAEKAERKGKPVVVVLDNAPFRTARVVEDRRCGWEERGLKLYYLPTYCPHARTPSRGCGAGSRAS